VLSAKAETGVSVEMTVKGNLNLKGAGKMKISKRAADVPPSADSE
jgi:hypothetical protein